MDLNQIRYFIHLSDTLNFTEAARRCGVSQPSLTKAIQRLENELGGPLIYRDGKDTRLTALGRDMQVEFMRVDALMNGIRDLAENSVSGRTRTLTVGVATTIAPNAMSGFVALVLRQLPSLTLEFAPLQAGESEAEVLSGKYDACILPEPPEPNFKLTIVPLFRENLMIAMSKDHPLSTWEEIPPEMMAKEHYLDRVHCEFRSRVVAHFMDRSIVMRPSIRSEREDWVQHMVAAGLGVCSLPERSAVVPGLALRPVQGMNISREVTLVAVSGTGSPVEMRQILSLAKAYEW